MAKLETCGEKGLAQQGSKDALLEELEDFLRENAERRLCMAAVDVEHFKLDEAGCNWEQYSPSMREKLKQRQQLLIEIERALQNKEFCFYLQPKCNSMTHAIVGMEALVRWNHPTRGIVSPGEFVPLMEETGLITRLDLYLWEEVCQMLHGWKARNENMVPISVNVSISDIAALDVAQVLWELVQKYQLEPKLLLVEITESMLAQNLKMVENTIAALHRKGFAVLMDDFGSGYSSLNMLRNTSVDAIKLDMQFIVRDSESSKGRQIVESVIEMARRLNLPIIAEGVETQEQVFMLQSMDCLYTQGYYFYKPMAVKQAEELLAQPAMENYWDLRRDMTRRNYKAFTGGLVSEKSAITLQAFQILADNALMLARLDLVTGEYRIVKRDERLMGVSEFGDGSDEERESGESWQEFYPVQFSDGPAQVQLFCNVVLNWWVLFSKLLIVFCVGVFLVVFWFACRRIVKYIIQLSEEIQAMEGGDLDHPITIRGEDELTTLARCLDSMRVTLRQQQEEEAKASAKVKNLITEMSHDLRTPLTTLLLYTEIVRSRKYENDAQKDDYLNKIDTKARQLKQLSDNLFEYALVTRDTVVTLDPPAYFSRIFEEPLAEMVDTLQQRGFACALDLGSEDLMLTVKMQYIRRVFDNITSNAIKYADPGREISVTFRKEEKWVGLRFANHVLPGQHREESTQVGLTSIETMMEKMNAVCRVEQGTEQFAITLLFPIT